MNNLIELLANIRRRLIYFFSGQRRKQKKIDELFNSRKKVNKKTKKCNL